MNHFGNIRTINYTVRLVCVCCREKPKLAWLLLTNISTGPCGKSKSRIVFCLKGNGDINTVVLEDRSIDKTNSIDHLLPPGLELGLN